MHAIAPALATALVFMAAMVPANAAQTDEAQFLTEAIRSNYAQIQLRRLAEANGGNEEIKAFGRTITADHEAANAGAIPWRSIWASISPKAPVNSNSRNTRH